MFFFKQKTAYEMRISDWSSDVCSSDLGNGAPKCRDLTEEHRRDEGGAQQGRVDLRRYQQKRGNGEQHLLPHPRAHQHETGEGSTETGDAGRAADEGDEELAPGEIGDDQQQRGRSEEHTSELQSQMRRSYAGTT